MFAISHFGGIIPRLSDHMLAEYQATKAHDVKLRNGRLEAWRQPCQFGREPVKDAKMFWLYGCCMPSWTQIMDVATLGPDWGGYFFTDHCGNGLYYSAVDSCCNETVRKYGIAAPYNAPSVSAGSECGRDADARSYVYTCIDEHGAESAPSPASNIVRVNDGTAVTISGLTATDNAKEINIYRAASGFREMNGKVQTPLTEYLYVDTIPARQTSYTDNIRTLALGAALETQYDRMPPDGMTGLVSIGDQVRLAAFIRNRIFFSEQFQPHNWPAKYDLTLDHNIVRMMVQDQRIFVTTDSVPYIIDVSGCDDTRCTPVSQLEMPLPDIGCVRPHGAVMTEHGLFYASNIGIILLQSNGQWHIVTSRWFGQDEWHKLMPDTIRMAYWEGYLVFATDMATFMLDINGKPYGDMQDGELCTLSIRPDDLLVSNTGKLLFLEDNKVWVWDSGDSYLPYIWESRKILADPKAYGNNEQAAQNLAESPLWWPTEIKLTGEAKILLYNSHSDMIFYRFMADSRARKIPRCGRHAWYQMQIIGTQPVYSVSLGNSSFTAYRGQ